ncbi:hypothetical protein ABT115_16085 [Streptomyces sp. NPDC001832]|uniref:hypothetical protein n=1 Tax=Streptomyces sp. NPDC001832 TaxID=3154527 RepID=UPI0033205BD2
MFVRGRTGNSAHQPGEFAGVPFRRGADLPARVPVGPVALFGVDVPVAARVRPVRKDDTDPPGRPGEFGGPGGCSEFVAGLGRGQAEAGENAGEAGETGVVDEELDDLVPGGVAEGRGGLLGGLPDRLGCVCPPLGGEPPGAAGDRQSGRGSNPGSMAAVSWTPSPSPASRNWSRLLQ